MKKAKIMLTAIAVLSVVGAVLAFKAKVYANVYCKLSSGACEKTVYTTVRPDPPIANTTTNPCPTPGKTVYYTEDQCITSWLESLYTVYETAL